MLTIYHNGECSKCRGALEILQERGVPHTVRWYLADPLSKDEIEALLKKLNIPAAGLVRTSEALYQAQYADRKITDSEWVDILAANPVLVQRPIVEVQDRAIIARPPEKVFDLIGG